MLFKIMIIIIETRIVKLGPNFKIIKQLIIINNIRNNFLLITLNKRTLHFCIKHLFFIFGLPYFTFIFFFKSVFFIKLYLLFLVPIHFFLSVPIVDIIVS